MAERFIAYVRESSSKNLEMSFFINLDVENILKQAAASTLRYQQGQLILSSSFFLVAKLTRNIRVQ